MERIENARVRQRRRDEREAMRNYRAMVRAQKEHAKQVDKARAADEVEQFERYVELLVSLHKECSDPWDWPRLASSAPPPPPTRSDERERSARAERDGYLPGVFERWFGGAKRRVSALDEQIALAREHDEHCYRQAYEAYQRDYQTWHTHRDIGSRLVAGQLGAYGEALNVAGAFDELATFQTAVEIVSARPSEIALACRVTDEEVVPSEEVTLTSTGKLSNKDMAKSRYWALYQDHLCSAAIRIAREALAVLPLNRVVVNLGPVRLNTSTGHRETTTYVAAQFNHESLGRLNLQRIDPSDSMANFPHRMRFKKTSGFEPVEPMTLEENWMVSR